MPDEKSLSQFVPRNVDNFPWVWRIHCVWQFFRKRHRSRKGHAVFEVDDIESTVQSLKEAGVEFLSYGGEIKTDEMCIHRENDMAIAWFADPCGNVLSVIESKRAQH